VRLADSAPPADFVHRQQSSAATPPTKPWRFTLAGKLTGAFATLALIFGVSASIISYTRLAPTLETEMKRRADLSVIGLSELAKQYGKETGEVELRQAVDGYESDESIAYVYIEDPQGQIVAHTPRELPTFLLRDFPRTAERALGGVDVIYRGLRVYEVAARVDGAQPGYVHLAIWRHAVEAETRRVVTSILVSILLSLTVAVAFCAWAVCYFTLPLSNLGIYAHRVSRGEIDLDIELQENQALQENSEIGSLACSFARMRSSLHAIVTRLENVSSTGHSDDFN
jgi:HAMP domain-containing protein